MFYKFQNTGIMFKIARQLLAIEEKVINCALGPRTHKPYFKYRVVCPVALYRALTQSCCVCESAAPHVTSSPSFNNRNWGIRYG